MLPKAVQKPRGHYEKIYSDSGGSGGAGDGHFVSKPGSPPHIWCRKRAHTQVLEDVEGFQLLPQATAPDWQMRIEDRSYKSVHQSHLQWFYANCLHFWRVVAILFQN